MRNPELEKQIRKLEAEGHTYCDWCYWHEGRITRATWVPTGMNSEIDAWCDDHVQHSGGPTKKVEA